MSAIFAGLCAALALGVVALAGCSPKKDEGGAASPSGGSATSPAPKTGGDATALFQANCANCHRLGSLGGGRAPDLSHEGAQHDAAWIGAQIKNPKDHDRGSRMPAFGSKLSEAEIKTLADHLAAQK